MEDGRVPGAGGEDPAPRTDADSAARIPGRPARLTFSSSGGARRAGYAREKRALKLTSLYQQTSVFGGEARPRNSTSRRLYLYDLAATLTRMLTASTATTNVAKCSIVPTHGANTSAHAWMKFP